jgi:hypothetical protein
VFEHILENDYDLVILSGAFNNYLNWNLLGLEDSTYRINKQQTQKAFLHGVNRTLEAFDSRNLDFIIVTQSPRFEEDVPLSFLRQSILTGQYDKESMDISLYNNQVETFKTLMPERWKEHVLDISQFFCRQETCRTASDNNELYYKDRHHISNFQARSMSKMMVDVIEKR